MITFDESPTVYWLIGYVLACVVIIATGRKKLPDGAFLALCIALLVFMRLPVIVFNRELNPDESQMLSHAITLFQDPVYWRSVDGTTIGPLDNYWLVIPRLLGFQIDYTAGRFMGLLCAAGAMIFLFFTLRNWFGNASRCVFATAVLLLACTQEVDFVHYSSEQLPVLMLAGCIWLLSQLKEKITVRKLYLLGLVAGALPFSKLQVVPLALVVVASAGWYCIVFFREKRKVAPGIALVAGGLSFPLTVLCWTLYFHVFRDLIDFYLLGNVIYAGGAGFFAIPAQLIAIYRRTFDFSAFSILLIIPMFIGLTRTFGEKKADLHIPLTIIGLVFASVYAVTKSGNDFVHYFNFCIIPWTLLAAYGFKGMANWRIAFPAVMLACFICADFISYKNKHQLNAFPSVGARQLGQSAVSDALKKYVRPGDYMTVWGWQCIYYVEAQLAQGTAENHSERSIFAHPLRETYRRRYLSDIQRTQPAVVLDAVGKNSFGCRIEIRRICAAFQRFLIMSQKIIAWPAITTEPGYISGMTG